MKIVFTPLLGSSVTLAEDNSARENPRDLKKQVRGAVQPLEAIGAPQLDQFARGNVRTDLSFRVRRQFTTIELALVWWLDSDSVTDTKGHVTITQGTSIRYIPNAIVQSISDNPQGVSVHISYQITGGKITSEDPS